jgi:hypothetical protein
LQDRPATEFRPRAEALVAGWTLVWQERPAQGAPDIGKPLDRALRIWLMDQRCPNRWGQGFSQGLCLVAGASYSVAYWRDHSRSQRPIRAHAAELRIGCAYPPHARHAGPSAGAVRRQRASEVAIDRARPRAGLMHTRTCTSKRGMLSLAPATRASEWAAAGRWPAADRRGAAAACWRRRGWIARCRGHAPCQIQSP